MLHRVLLADDRSVEETEALPQVIDSTTDGVLTTHRYVGAKRRPESLDKLRCGLKPRVPILGQTVFNQSVDSGRNSFIRIRKGLKPPG